MLKGIHQKDYTAEVAKLADLFSVTYDPAMIKAAVDDMVTHIEGGTVTQDHVIAVSVVDAIFESCSAFGTVGLSVGVTSQLNNGAKILYMLVMFMGRVGPVAFAMSLTAKPDDNKRKIMPVGHINVG